MLLLFVLLDSACSLAWRLVVDRTDAGASGGWRSSAAAPAARELAPKLCAARAGTAWGGGHVPTPDEPLPDEPRTRRWAPCLGTPGDLPALLAEGRIDDMILVGSDRLLADAADRQPGRRRRPDHTNVLLLPGPFESLIGRMRYRWVHDLPLIEVVREAEWRINWPLKRLLDLAAGSFLLLLAAPVSPPARWPCALTSPGPVLYRQDAGRPRAAAVHAPQAAHHAAWTPRRRRARCWPSPATRG